MLVGLLAVAMAQSAPPPQEQEFMVYGIGINTCAEYTLAARSDNAYARDAYTSWIMGFVSGVTIMEKRRRGRIAPTTTRAWIDNYCATNQLDSVYEASREFILALWAKDNASD